MQFVAEDSPALVAARDEIQALTAQLAIESEARRRVQSALDLRNAALDAASTHIMIVDVRDERRQIAYVNRALAVEHGYDGAESLIGQSVFILGAGLDASARAVISQMVVESRAARAEFEFTRRDGTKFLCGIAFAPLLDSNGEMTHYVTLGADITRRKEDERREKGLREQLLSEMREREKMSIELRLAQKLESVGRLASGLAHEINTPIQYVCDSVHFLTSACKDIESVLNAYRTRFQALTGESDLREELLQLQATEASLDMEFLAVEVPKALGRTLEGADRVAGIVRAMKEFAYPDQAVHAEADLNRSLATTLVVAKNEYKYLAEVETCLGELPFVVCNAGEINQVFLNLIVNAAHAIQDSGKDTSTGRIGIETRVNGDVVEIIVSDNGCGIDAAVVEKIFDPFYTTKEVGRGTGQGLSIARSIIIDKHGGRIEVDSTPGVGTRFVVTLYVNGKPAQVRE